MKQYLTNALLLKDLLFSFFKLVINLYNGMIIEENRQMIYYLDQLMLEIEKYDYSITTTCQR